MLEEDEKLNLKRHRRHQRKVPINLIIRIIIVAVLLVLIFFVSETVVNKLNNQEQEIDLKNFSTEQSDSLE